jgi:hypothetical protein
LFAGAVFSKLPQELPLVALCQQEKISPIFTRLSIAIGARGGSAQLAVFSHHWTFIFVILQEDEIVISYEAGKT